MRFMLQTRSQGWLVVVLLFGVLFGLPKVSSGHAFLEAAEPGENAVVSELPGAIRLAFSEPVETAFSVFKVYPLSPNPDAAALQADARRLVDEVLLARGDDEARADIGLMGNPGRADEIQIVLRENLPAGPYVVMWRVLSVDTHTTLGHYIFTYEPVVDGAQ